MRCQLTSGAAGFKRVATAQSEFEPWTSFESPPAPSLAPAESFRATLIVFSSFASAFERNSTKTGASTNPPVVARTSPPGRKHHVARVDCAVGQLDDAFLVALGQLFALVGGDRVDRHKVGVELDGHEFLEQRDDLGSGNTPTSIARQLAQFTPVKSIRIGLCSALRRVERLVEAHSPLHAVDSFFLALGLVGVGRRGLHLGERGLAAGQVRRERPAHRARWSRAARVPRSAGSRRRSGARGRTGPAP